MTIALTSIVYTVADRVVVKAVTGAFTVIYVQNSKEKGVYRKLKTPRN